MNDKMKFARIDDYLASVPADARRVLEEIRCLVKANVPGATETISYQIPAFKLDRVFFYFAAFKTHVGIYPPVKGSKDLQKALLAYRGEKGNLKFPLDQPMPCDLVGRVASALAQERSK